MFCPKCATQNLDGAKFCRSCGVNVSLVPQALSGQLPEATPDDVDCFGRDRKRRSRREPGLDSAFRSAFMGLAFLLVAIALAFSRMGGGWWFWMLIPAFSMMGTGIAQYIRIKEREKRMFQAGSFSQSALQPPLNNQMHVGTIAARNTGELVAPPPSVTEGTTRHLGAEAPTRHFGGAGEVPK
jgi:predicted phage tail protein